MNSLQWSSNLSILPLIHKSLTAALLEKVVEVSRVSTTRRHACLSILNIPLLSLPTIITIIIFLF